MTTKKAYSELQTDAIKNNYSMNQGEVRAGFYVLSNNINGGSTKVFQTWTIPADSIISNHKKGIANLTLGYKDYSSTTSDFKDSNGNTIPVINLNNVSNATTIFMLYPNFRTEKSRFYKWKTIIFNLKIIQKCQKE